MPDDGVSLAKSILLPAHPRSAQSFGWPVSFVVAKSNGN